MSIEIARYQFHSWARKGISTNITMGDDLGTGSSTDTERAEVPVSVNLNDSGITKKFSLIGPGDIIGINRDMIVRTEPLNGVTDSEPNYLAFVEFYDEDFAWRYTPAKPPEQEPGKLRPWLFLLVLKEDEFQRGRRKVPLPVITVKNDNAFPPNDETWLWAHVHSNADIPDEELSDYEEFLLSLNKTVNDDPDQVYSRLVSPRKLEPNTGYYAFVIPTFETGRLAGLGQEIGSVKAQAPSWGTVDANIEMPVYYEWFFRTGTNVDFESLVKLLEPREMDPRVGIRDMDCSQPGFVQADDNTQEIPGTEPPIIGLEGALKSPTTVSTVFPDPPEDNQFQVELQKVVNLPETIPADLTGDPIVSVPLYGRYHAKKSSSDKVLLDIAKKTWLHQLNRDPRTRTAAGFGTLVVQENQESFMKKAWRQVMKIVDANRIISAAKFMLTVGVQYTRKTFSKFSDPVLLAVTGPLLKRIKGSPTTIYRQLRESRLPAAVFSGSFRRMVRPNGPVAKKAGRETSFNYSQMVHDVNDGKISAAPPGEIPAGLFTTRDIADTVFPYRIPGWLKWLLKYSHIILAVLLLLFILIAVLTGSFVLYGILAAGSGILIPVLNPLRKNADAAAGVLDNREQAERFESAGQKPGFTLTLSDETDTPPPTVTTPGRDSVEAKNFRQAGVELNALLAVKVPEKIATAFDMTNAFGKVSQAIHPHKSFPSRLEWRVRFPGVNFELAPEKIFPAMAYPDIEDPMYKKLDEISSELLLPNLQLIPPNTISLLKTNQPFIESYMVGLNHEMGGELLWREFPTDRRGSYFRQFWDVKGIIQPGEGKTEAELTEEYKDIEPIHTWPRRSSLGRHNKRDAEGDAEQLVLVIRGDLLQRYPNTVIFAQKAIKGENEDDDPVIDLELDENEFKKDVKFPLYKAEIDPDYKFFGFDLTVEQARGTEPTPGFDDDDDLGWFFIIQEVPGEPRFGMDISYDPGSDGKTWDDLAWDRFDPPLKFIIAGTLPTFSPDPEHDDPNMWGAGSAEMAYILFQKPSMVAVHAKEMLKDLKP